MEAARSILLVEDNLGDVELFREVLETINISIHLTVARNGMEALAILRKEGPYAQVLSPHLILVDLNLPMKDGRELIKELKSDEGLKRIPTIVLTTSESESDIAYCYEQHANCYVVKPVDFEDLADTIKCIIEFWFHKIKLPPIRR